MRYARLMSGQSILVPGIWPSGRPDMAFSRRQIYIHAEDHMPLFKGCSCSLGVELIVRLDHDRLLSVQRQLIHDTRLPTRHCCTLRSSFLMRYACGFYVLPAGPSHRRHKAKLVQARAYSTLETIDALIFSLARRKPPKCPCDDKWS